jgi:hypothetical protein
MTSALFINGIVASPFLFSPAPAFAFFVNIFEIDSGKWLGTVPSASAAAIPLSRFPLVSSQAYKSAHRLLPFGLRCSFTSALQVSNKRYHRFVLGFPLQRNVFCKCIFVP